MWTIRTYLYHLTALTVKILPRRKSRQYDVVIVKIESLGDYVIWHDALSAYQRKFQGKRVLLVCPKLNVSLAKCEDLFTDIFEVKTPKFNRNLLYLLNVVIHLRTIKAEIVYYPVWARHPIGDLLVAMIEAPQKISYWMNGKRMPITKWYDRQYTKLVRYDTSVSEIGAVEYFTKQAVDEDYQYGLYPLVVKERESCNVSVKSPYIVIAFSASQDWKIWEMEKFVEVIDSISMQYNIVLTGNGLNDVNRAENIRNHVNNKERIINMVNKTSVVDLVSLISRSCLVIGNDSAMVHIAAATHVKSICILHGAHFNRFLPYPEGLPFKEYSPQSIYYKMNCFDCKYRCIYINQTPFECLKRVTADKVIVEVDKILRS